MNAKRVYGYIRVSTEEQSRSQLGIGAQKEAIEGFCRTQGYELVAIYEEVGSGAGADAIEKRPVLREALAAAKKNGSGIIVARLDRLSRSVEFIAGAISRGVDFMVCDLGPTVPTMVLHVVAAVAEEERRLISRRTKEGLERLRQRIDAGLEAPDKRFAGNPRIQKNKERAAAGASAKANQAAVRIWPNIRHYREQGLALREIAKRLNTDGLRTARGSDWSAMAIKRVIARIEAIGTIKVDTAA